MREKAVKKRVVCLGLLFLLFGTGVAVGQAAAKPTTNQNRVAKPESFWDKVLRYAGISHDPSHLKAPGDEVVSGQIWVADLGAGTKHSVTPGGGYRSPVFVPGGKAIVALRGADLVRIDTNGGEPLKLYRMVQITKLVGFSLDDPDQILALNGTPAQPVVEFLSLKSGAVTPLPFDAASHRDLEMIQHLRSWERVYGDKSIYTERRSADTLYGRAEWTDVFLKTGGQDAVNVSRCDKVNCGQPSLSADGRLAVFVQSDKE